MNPFAEGHGPAVPAGPLGHDSADLIDYYEAVQGVPRIREGLNPATWCVPLSAFVHLVLHAGPARAQSLVYIKCWIA